MNARDERGLIGKIVVLWLLVLAAIVVLALDGGSIVLTRLRVADLARDASRDAAETLDLTGSEEAAKLAALQTIEEADTRARLQRIEIRGSNVRVVLTARADTLVVARVPFLDHLAKVTGTATGSTSGG